MFVFYHFLFLSAALPLLTQPPACDAPSSETGECLVHPTHYHRLGENEATWGRAASWTSEDNASADRLVGSSTEVPATTTAEVVSETGAGAEVEPEAPTDVLIQEEPCTAAVASRVGELESTWGKAQEPNPEFPKPDVKAGGDGNEHLSVCFPVYICIHVCLVVSQPLFVSEIFRHGEKGTCF